MTPARLIKWFDPRLHEGPSRIDRRGILAREPVRAGEILMRWGGLLLPVADFTPALYRLSSTTHYDERLCLTTPIDEPRSLDERLNHSCDPSAWLVDEITLCARRAIDAGAEVTADFATWEDSEHVLTSDCGCGTALCRRRVTGRDFRLPALQLRYRGHFLPYLDRAIAALHGDSQAPADTGRAHEAPARPRRRPLAERPRLTSAGARVRLTACRRGKRPTSSSPPGSPPSSRSPTLAASCAQARCSGCPSPG